MCRLRPWRHRFCLGRVSGQSGTRPRGPMVRVSSVTPLVECERGWNGRQTSRMKIGRPRSCDSERFAIAVLDSS